MTDPCPVCEEVHKDDDSWDDIRYGHCREVIASVAAALAKLGKKAPEKALLAETMRQSKGHINPLDALNELKRVTEGTKQFRAVITQVDDDDSVDEEGDGTASSVEVTLALFDVSPEMLEWFRNRVYVKAAKPNESDMLDVTMVKKRKMFYIPKHLDVQE